MIDAYDAFSQTWSRLRPKRQEDILTTVRKELEDHVNDMGRDIAAKSGCEVHEDYSEDDESWEEMLQARSHSRRDDEN